MAGYQLNTDSLGSTDWTGWINANEKVWKGYIDITVNNWDTTGVPSIAKGGCMELGGSIFYFGDTEAITGTPSTDNLNYIMATVSSTNVALSYTTTAPSWIANKGGWYDATEAKRYVGGCGIDLDNKFTYGQIRDIKYLNQNPTLSSSVTRFYAVPLTGFTSATTVHTYGTMIEWTAVGTAWIPVALPHGAIITELYSQVIVPDNNIVVELNRSTLASSAVDTMASNTHTGDGSMGDTSISNGTIDNGSYNYHVRCLRATHSDTAELYSVRIQYTITNLLP